MAKRMIEVTTNLVQLYLHSCGEKSDIPDAYHVWCCLSMIAAAVANRVYFYRLREWPIFPNLYTFLIGDSGSGKGVAIKKMEKFIREIPIVNYKRLRTTSEYLIDVLGKPKIDPATGQRVLANANVMLCMPEITAYIRKGEHSENLMQIMTELYGGESEFSDGTRTHGITTIRNSCINWLIGSTKKWLLKAMTPDTVESGLFARVVTVYPEEAKLGEKVARVWDDIEYPDDYDEVMAYIQARVYGLTQISGEMYMSDKANAYIRQWVENRPEPDDETMMPWWRRERELCARLSMLLCLADGKGPTIRLPHVSTAIKLIKSVAINLPDLVDYSLQDRSTEKEAKVRAAIKRHGTIGHTKLARILSRNVNAAELRGAVFGLKDKKLITEGCSPGGGKIYTWTGDCSI